MQADPKSWGRGVSSGNHRLSKKVLENSATGLNIIWFMIVIINDCSFGSEKLKFYSQGIKAHF